MTYLPDPITGRDFGIPAEEWIEANHPENGLFRVYWKNVIEITEYNYLRYRDSLSGARCIGEATLDSEEGEGLRWEWYYKDGKRADGVSKGWYPNGQLKSKFNWKGRMHGLYQEWYDNGQKKLEGTQKDGKEDGLFTEWFKNGQKRKEVTFKDGKPDGYWIYWDREGHFKWFSEYSDSRKVR